MVSSGFLCSSLQFDIILLYPQSKVLPFEVISNGKINGLLRYIFYKISSFSFITGFHLLSYLRTFRCYISQLKRRSLFLLEIEVFGHTIFSRQVYLSRIQPAMTIISIPLFEVGCQGSGYHLRNKPGQLQRSHLVQQQHSGLSVAADLSSVTHGTLTSEGDQAMLIVIDFSFFAHRNKRFKAARIDMLFSTDDQSSEEDSDESDPVIVCKISPEGVVNTNSSTEQYEKSTTKRTSADLGISGIPVKIGVARETVVTTTSEHTAFAEVIGRKKIHGRSHGEHNMAQWSIKENPTLKTGITSSFQVAILLNSPPDVRFSATIEVTTDVGGIYGAYDSIRKFFGKDKVDPVKFGRKRQRVNMGEKPEALDINNMDCFDLKTISMIKVRILTTLLIYFKRQLII